MSGNFLDSNVPIYLLAADSLRAGRAEELLQGGGIVSVQVLNEIVSVARRKLKLDWARIEAFLADLEVFVGVVPLTHPMQRSGLKLAARHGFNIYDAMIVAAALESDCDILYSEDMHTGLVVDGRLTIVNPFA